jgi:acetylornithine deacetylase/succinyl-diaminopimelate desuccinylase-like protein
MTEPVLRPRAQASYDRLVPEHIRSIQELVRIPSTRGRERQAQEWIAAHMRGLGHSVELIDCDPQKLAKYPAWSPTEWQYEGRPNVAGVWRGGVPQRRNEHRRADLQTWCGRRRPRHRAADPSTSSRTDNPTVGLRGTDSTTRRGRG